MYFAVGVDGASLPSWVDPDGRTVYEGCVPVIDKGPCAPASNCCCEGLTAQASPLPRASEVHTDHLFACTYQCFPRRRYRGWAGCAARNWTRIRAVFAGYGVYHSVRLLSSDKICKEMMSCNVLSPSRTGAVTRTDTHVLHLPRTVGPHAHTHRRTCLGASPSAS